MTKLEDACQLQHGDLPIHVDIGAPHDVLRLLLRQLRPERVASAHQLVQADVSIMVLVKRLKEFPRLGANLEAVAELLEGHLAAVNNSLDPGLLLRFGLEGRDHRLDLLDRPVEVPDLLVAEELLQRDLIIAVGIKALEGIVRLLVGQRWM